MKFCSFTVRTNFEMSRMYGFSGSVVILPISQNSQTVLESASSNLHAEVLPTSIRLSFQTMDPDLFWHLGRLCDSRNFVLVEVSRPLPRIIKHKPSSIVFSDRNESVQYDDLVRPEHKLFNYESSDEGSPSRQGDDENNSSNDVSGVFPGLHRQFIISQKRKSMHKARLKRRWSRKEQEPSPTVKETKHETTSTEVKEDEITFSEEQVSLCTAETFYCTYFW